MSRPVHGAYVTIIVIVLYCGLCSCLQFNHENANKKFGNELDPDLSHVVEPLETNKNDVEIIPEDDVLFSTIKNKQADENKKEDIVANRMVTLRKKRQAYQGYTQLYPQLPSGSPYNPYQPQPNINPPGQSPHMQAPQPWSATNHSSFGPGNPPPQANNPNTGFYQNQGTYNYSQPGYPGNYNNQNGGINHTNPPYNPFTSQFAPANSSYPHNNHNGSSTHYPHSPSNGKYPSYNQTLNYPHNAGSYRPPNVSHPSYTTSWPPSSMNSSYPKNPGVGTSPTDHGNYPHNPTTPYNTNATLPSRPNQWQSNYPGSNGQTNFNSKIPNRNSSFGKYPQYPTSPYSNNATSHSRPNQWQSNYPGANGQYPTNTNVNPNYPSPNDARNSSFGNHNSSFAQYPQYPSSPYANNATSQWQPKYPGSNGQHPYNTNLNPSYPSPNSAINSSIANYPQNNFYYPQANNSAYDPRKVPPQRFSYH